MPDDIGILLMVVRCSCLIISIRHFRRKICIYQLGDYLDNSMEQIEKETGCWS